MQSNDFRFALRQLRKHPGFCVVAVLTLALGIGGTTAIFSVVNNVLLRPLAVQAPEKLAVVWNVWRGQVNGGLSAGDFSDLAQQYGSAETLAAVEGASLTLEDENAPERLAGQRATGGFFRMLGVKPLLGRSFSDAEDQPGQDGVVVLSESMWRSHFQADPKILGRSIRLNGRPYQIIGVMPSNFDPTGERPRFWIPMAFSAERKLNYDEQPYTVLARIKPSVTLERAQQELLAFSRARAPRFPQEGGMRSFTVQALEDALVAETRPALYMLLGAVIFVLLIACVNVGTLQLARARTRRKELAIRSALGASSGRLAWQMLTESFAVCLLGGAAGLFVAYGFLRWIVSRAPESIPRIDAVAIDGRALGFTLLMVIVSALLSGGWAAARARSADPGDDLRSARTSGDSSVRDRLRGAMVVTEIALALMLLVGAGLLIRSAMNANKVPLGFEPQNLIAARVSLPETRYSNPDRFKSTLERIQQEASSLPGVRSAALVDHAPLSGGGSNGLIPEGKPYTAEYVVQSALHMVTLNYFATTGTPLLAGRDFNSGDRKGAPAVMIVNKALAEAAFPGENPVGKRLSWTRNEWMTIVGVVANVRHYGVTENAPPEVYIPLVQANDVAVGWMKGTAEIMLGMQSERTQVIDELRAMIKQIDPSIPVHHVEPMKERVAATLQQRRFITTLLTSFAALATFLAAVGVYGVLSYVVSLRTQEIGIRIAVGAQQSQVLRMILADGLRLAAIGTILGIAGALAGGGLVSSLLFNVSPNDPTTLMAGALMVVALALLASFVPASRALQINPIIALRNE